MQATFVEPSKSLRDRSSGKSTSKGRTNMGGQTWRRMRFIVRVFMTTLLDGIRMNWRRGRFLRYKAEAQACIVRRDQYQRFAELARSRGDFADASRWDEYALSVDDWRRLYEHQALYGRDHMPPMPIAPRRPRVSRTSGSHFR